jgi:hypothetical protein
VVTRIDVGAKPYGATAATVRPTFETASDLTTALATLGLARDTET